MLTCGNKFIYHGGHIYGAFGDCVQSLNVSTSQWEALPPLSTQREGATPCEAQCLWRSMWHWSGGGASVERHNRRLQCWEAMPSLIDGSRVSASAVVQV